MKKSLASVKIFSVLVVLVILGFSLAYALDPQETSNQERDEMTRADADSLIEAIGGYFTKTEKFIWEGSKIKWTKAQELNLKVLVDDQFLLNIPKSAEEIYVGRGPGEKDKIWACFTPVSKHERADPIKLRGVVPGEDLPKDGTPSYCEKTPDYQTSFCFVCVAN